MIVNLIKRWFSLPEGGTFSSAQPGPDNEIIIDLSRYWRITPATDGRWRLETRVGWQGWESAGLYKTIDEAKADYIHLQHKPIDLAPEVRKS